MKRNNFRRQFVSIEYPGCVQNVDKMLKTLGGLDSISNTVDRQKLRMELRYRPDDVYCKPVCGNKVQISGLLLRVVIRKPKGDSQHVISSATVVGQIQTTFRFRTLCDFQYLAIDGKECIYKSLLPHDLPHSEWLFRDCDYFLPPPAFSRMDVPQAYLYRRDKPVEAPRDVIGCTRRRRAGHAVFATFDTETVPTSPRPLTLRAAQAKGLAGQPLLKVKQLFETRAVWSKSALLGASQLPADQLKVLLPCVAYYAVTGPWRIMWVRFGYDPRTDYSARVLQALDFRLRTAGGLKTKVKAKRSYSNYVLPYKSAPLRGKAEIAKNRSAATPTAHIFSPGVLPPSRQMFYQYCDLHVAQIQTILEKLPLPAPGTKCHERHGWLPPGLDDQCRDILHAVVLETLRNAPPDSELGTTLKAGELLEEEDEESVDDEEEEEWEEK